MEKTILKEGTVTKDMKRMKAGEASDLGVQDFFMNRDKSKRKTSGLVADSAQIIEEESKVKQKLYDESLEVDSLPGHIVPMFGGVFLTARRNKLVENGLFLPTASFGKGSDTDMDQDFSAEQTVLACGDHVSQLKTGYKVVLNMDNFKKRLESSLAQKLNKEFEYVLPIEIIDGVEYLYVSERDVKYISERRLG
jgi:hypothetical protein|tara:strand:- start:122 stop:703 length:582 start_codon:yes stop_codon:yes gene_type:complete